MGGVVSRRVGVSLGLLLSVVIVALTGGEGSRSRPVPAEEGERVASAGIRSAALKPRLVIDSGGHMAKIRDVMFSPDGERLLSVSNDKTVQVWGVASGERLAVFRGQQQEGDEGKLFAGALSPDGRWLAVGGWLTKGHGVDDEKVGNIRLLDARSGEVVRLLQEHTNVILGLAFSPDGQRLISGSADNTARIWDVASGEGLRLLQGHSEPIYAVAFSPDGRRVVTGSDDRSLRLWEAASGALIATLSGHEGKVKSAAFTPDGRYLLSGSWDKSIRLWDGRTGAFVKVLASQNRGTSSLTVSHNGSMVLAGSGSAGAGSFQPGLFALPSGAERLRFRGHDNIVLATAIAPDGRLAATGGFEGETFLWNLSDGGVQHELRGRGRQIWSVGFARDGGAIAWGQKSAYQAINDRGPLQHTLQLESDGRPDLALGAAVGDDRGWQRAIQQVGAIAIDTANGQSHPTLEIRRHGQLQHQITRGPTDGFDHRSLTLTPDGATVISGGSNGNLTSYRSATGERLQDFIGHTGDVWAVAPSPDGRYLLSGSADQTVRLWAIASGRLLLTLFPAADGEWVAWSPEGHYTASLGGARYIGWQINQGEEKAALYYPAARFADLFHRPRVVAHYVATGGDLTRAMELAEAERPRPQALPPVAATAAETVIQRLPPTVSLNDPRERLFTTSYPRLRVVAEAQGINGEPVTDLWLSHNGQRVDRRGAGSGSGSNERGSRGLEQEVQLEGDWGLIDWTLELERGENRIAVVAANRYGRSEPEIVRVTWEAAQSPGSSAGSLEALYKPALYLLAVGISDYRAAGLDLEFAHADAEGVARAFKAQEGRLYREVKTRLLTDAAATRAGILEGLDWLLSEATQRDLAVIFVAGHGMKDFDGRYFLLPHDVTRGRLRSSGVLWTEFDNTLLRLPGKRWLLADTCHAGGITGKRGEGRTRGDGRVDITEALRDLLAADEGIVVMAGSTGRELSVERREWGHGAFTKALLEGIEGQRADYNRDRRIDIKELDLYITDRVKALTNGQQHPTTEIPAIMPNFPVAVGF